MLSVNKELAARVNKELAARHGERDSADEARRDQEPAEHLALSARMFAIRRGNRPPFPTHVSQRRETGVFYFCLAEYLTG